MSTFFEAANLLCNLIEPTADVVIKVRDEERDKHGCIPEDLSKTLLEWAGATIADLRAEVERLRWVVEQYDDLSRSHSGIPAASFYERRWSAREEEE